jgi:hypothetical protein
LARRHAREGEQAISGFRQAVGNGSMLECQSAFKFGSDALLMMFYR